MILINYQIRLAALFIENICFLCFARTLYINLYRVRVFTVYTDYLLTIIFIKMKTEKNEMIQTMICLNLINPTEKLKSEIITNINEYWEIDEKKIKKARSIMEICDIVNNTLTIDKKEMIEERINFICSCILKLIDNKKIV